MMQNFARTSMFHFLFILSAVLLSISGFANAQEANSSAPIIAQTIEPEDNPLEDVPEEYIEEALNFFDRCEAEPRFNRHYNCECLSSNYLDKRIEVGSDMGSNGILLAIEKTCADATLAAGYYYEQCLNNHSLISTDNVSIGDYCECFGNEYARIYESFDVEPNSETFIAVQTRAMVACKNPELSRRVYQYVPKTRIKNQP